MEPIELSDSNNIGKRQFPPKHDECKIQTIFHPAPYISMDLTDDGISPPKYEDINIQ